MSNAESNKGNLFQPDGNPGKHLRPCSEEEEKYPLNEFCSYIPFGSQSLLEVNSLCNVLDEAEKTEDLRNVHARLESRGINLQGTQGVYALRYIEVIARLNVLSYERGSRRISPVKRQEIDREMNTAKDRFYDFERSLSGEGQDNFIDCQPGCILPRSAMMDARKLVESAFKAKLKGDQQIWL